VHLSDKMPTSLEAAVAPRAGKFINFMPSIFLKEEKFYYKMLYYIFLFRSVNRPFPKLLKNEILKYNIYYNFNSISFPKKNWVLEALTADWRSIIR